MKPSSSGTPVVLIIVLVVLATGCVISVPCLIALLLPAVQMARESARMQVSGNNLRQIGIGLQMYHDVHKTFPPAFIVDENGRAKTSWRAMLLPFLEQQGLYSQYDFNVAWDDPRNEQVRRTQLPFLQSPRDPIQGTNRTSYVVVTMRQPAKAGVRTAFSGERASRLSDFVDGWANTILVLEILNSDIEWAEPRDIDIDSLSTDPRAPNSINLNTGVVVVMGDGSVRTLRNTSLETLRALLTANGGERIQQ